MNWPWEEACRNHWAVNLPGPQGPAGAQEASLTSCREKGFDATPLLGTTVNSVPIEIGSQGLGAWLFISECDINMDCLCAEFYYTVNL